MAKQKSHKNPAAADAEHYQPRSHAGMTKKYGKEDGENPKRKVAAYTENIGQGGVVTKDTHTYEGGLDDRISGAYRQEIRGY